MITWGFPRTTIPGAWVQWKVKTMSPTGESACKTTKSVKVGSGVTGQEATGSASQVLLVPIVALKLP